MVTSRPLAGVTTGRKITRIPGHLLELSLHVRFGNWSINISWELVRNRDFPVPLNLLSESQHSIEIPR